MLLCSIQTEYENIPLEIGPKMIVHKISSGPEAVTRKCSIKKVFLETLQNSQENTCARVSFLIKLQALACNFVEKQTLSQVFSWVFCEISKDNLSYRTPPMAASVWTSYISSIYILCLGERRWRFLSLIYIW